MSKINVASAIRTAMRIAARDFDDSEALEVSVLFEMWQPGKDYSVNQLVKYNSQLYRVMVSVTSQAHQPPDAPGMLAVYRPLTGTSSEEGTLLNPIPFMIGMDCFSGKYYSYLSKTYLCKGDLVPCVWPPDSPGVWQWEAV